jgi:RNA polymerase sigma factor (sigma-70 family)
MASTDSSLSGVKHARARKMKEADKIFLRLIEPIENQMIGIICRITRDPEETEDVFQNVLEEIWSNLKKINRYSNTQAYILRICVSCSYDALRKRSNRRRYEAFFENIKSMILPNYTNNFVTERDRELAMHEAIAMLPHKQGKAVFLRSIESLPYDIIGNILGCSEATARSHFSKGRIRLGKILSEMGISIKRKRM